MPRDGGPHHGVAPARPSPVAETGWGRLCATGADGDRRLGRRGLARASRTLTRGQDARGRRIFSVDRRRGGQAAALARTGSLAPTRRGRRGGSVGSPQPVLGS